MLIFCISINIQPHFAQGFSHAYQQHTLVVYPEAGRSLAPDVFGLSVRAVTAAEAFDSVLHGVHYEINR